MVRVVNFSDIKFMAEKQKLLEKVLKCAPPLSINREKQITECETFTENIVNEETKKCVRHKVSNIVEKIYLKKAKKR